MCMSKLKTIIDELFDCRNGIEFIDKIEKEVKMEKKNTLASVIPVIVTVLIAFFGNYMITTNKVSATDARVEMYQQRIDELSKKMDHLNDNQAVLSSQIATITETLKYKKDK